MVGVPYQEEIEIEPIFPDLLIDMIVARIPHGERAIAIIDGADAADPVEFAGRVRDRITAGSRACEVIDLHDFVRPASLRYEYSKTDELTYRTAWFDFGALEREVISPLGPGGRARYLPRLWDESSDRSARAQMVDATEDQILILAGPMMLDRVRTSAVFVHLHLSPGALRRRTPPEQQWTIPPIIAYYNDTHARPDMTVRWDHPARPAVVPSTVLRNR